MLRLIESCAAEIAELCRRFHVTRLDVFGSAARVTDFDPAHSDIDLLVSYAAGHPPSAWDHLALRDALSTLLGHKVDLVMANSVENPFVRIGIERSRQPLYEPSR
jgi:predicted nucleotidyltransferase